MTEESPNFPQPQNGVYMCIGVYSISRVSVFTVVLAFYSVPPSIADNTPGCKRPALLKGQKLEILLRGPCIQQWGILPLVLQSQNVAQKTRRALNFTSSYITVQ